MEFMQGHAEDCDEPELHMPYLTRGESSSECLSRGLVCSIDPGTGRCTECGAAECRCTHEATCPEHGAHAEQHHDPIDHEPF
jgi:hypothetical protein